MSTAAHSTAVCTCSRLWRSGRGGMQTCSIRWSPHSARGHEAAPLCGGAQADNQVCTAGYVPLYAMLTSVAQWQRCRLAPQAAPAAAAAGVAAGAMAWPAGCGEQVGRVMRARSALQLLQLLTSAVRSAQGLLLLHARPAALPCTPELRCNQVLAAAARCRWPSYLLLRGLCTGCAAAERSCTSQQPSSPVQH